MRRILCQGTSPDEWNNDERLRGQQALINDTQVIDMLGVQMFMYTHSHTHTHSYALTQSHTQIGIFERLADAVETHNSDRK